jgi:hypothetical protein
MWKITDIAEGKVNIINNTSTNVLRVQFKTNKKHTKFGVSIIISETWQKMSNRLPSNYYFLNM